MAGTAFTSNHPAQKLLQLAHSPTTASSIFTDKVLHRPLTLLSSVPDQGSRDARAARRLVRLRRDQHTLRRRKPGPLSAKAKRALGIYDLPASACQYALFEPLHALWVGYMQEVLGLSEGKAHVSAQSAGAVVASADFHGAEVEVVRCGCVERVGQRGIVVRDAKFAVEIVTRGDRKITVPKGNAVFRIEVPVPAQAEEMVSGGNGGNNTMGESTKMEANRDGEDTAATGKLSNNELTKPKVLVFELHGKQLECRAIDRATKKFKQRRMDYL